MGSEHKELTIAHFHALDLHRGSIKQTAQPKGVTIDIGEPFHIRECDYAR
jgi:hypothetical protein